jgi:hypothetical protein
MSVSDDFSDRPLSHLQVAGLAFKALTSEPRLLSLDCSTLDGRRGAELGLPEREVLLSQLRAWMLEHPGNHAAINAIWRELIRLARRPGNAGNPDHKTDSQVDGGADGRNVWQLAAIGMAMPRLVKQAGSLARDFRGDPADIDAAIVEGFLHALTRRLDLAEQGLHVKLCWAGYRAGYDVRYADADVVYCDDLDNEAAAPHRPYGHVDLLLARAVALELIDPDEAALIIDTRLEYQPIEQLADQSATEVSTLRRRRERAGQRLAGGLAEGHLSGPVSPSVRRELARNAAKRRAARQQSDGAAMTGTVATTAA